jgi:hypothetical protein
MGTWRRLGELSWLTAELQNSNEMTRLLGEWISQLCGSCWSSDRTLAITKVNKALFAVSFDSKRFWETFKGFTNWILRRTQLPMASPNHKLVYFSTTSLEVWNGSNKISGNKTEKETRVSLIVCELCTLDRYCDCSCGFVNETLSIPCRLDQLFTSPFPIPSTNLQPNKFEGPQNTTELVTQWNHCRKKEKFVSCVEESFAVCEFVKAVSRCRVHFERIFVVLLSKSLLFTASFLSFESLLAM